MRFIAEPGVHEHCTSVPGTAPTSSGIASLDVPERQ